MALADLLLLGYKEAEIAQRAHWDKGRTAVRIFRLRRKIGKLIKDRAL
jgi:DNA-directed RNA polymerase specialized sigma24 family protein